MFSALSSPSLTGSLFGGNSPYGSTAASALSSNLLGSGSGLTSSSMATAAALAVTAALLYPKVTGLFTDGKTLSFRDGKFDY